MNTLFTCYSGSKLYGTNTATSDTDMNGVHLPTKSEILLDKQIHHIRHSPVTTGKNNSNDKDINTVSLIRFFEDILYGRPQSIEMLFAPAEYETALWRQVKTIGMSLLNSKLSGLTGMAFNSKTKSYKDYYHKLRSLYILEEIHNTGSLAFPLQDKNLLIRIKEGVFSIDELDKAVTNMKSTCKKAKETSLLPDFVDMGIAYTFVEKIHKDIVNDSL